MMMNMCEVVDDVAVVVCVSVSGGMGMHPPKHLIHNQTNHVTKSSHGRLRSRCGYNKQDEAFGPLDCHAPGCVSSLRF